MIVYKITNTINNKVYIGQTIRTLHQRKNEHKRYFKHNNPYLKNAFKFYGFNNFTFTIIDKATNINELNEKEIFWIKHYDALNKKKGYNIMDGGKNSIIAKETKEKMSQAHKGKKQSSTWVSNRIAKAGSEDAKKYGRIKTEEEKVILSKNAARHWQGKNRDEETKLKISKTKKEQGLLPPNAKKVVKYDAISGNVITMYDSTVKAAEMNAGYSQSTISRLCSGKSKNKGHIHWKYI